VRRDLGSGEGIPRVETDTAAGSRAIGSQGTEIGGKVVARVFSGNAALDGVATHIDGALRRNIDLRIGKLHPLGNQNLVLDKVSAGYHLGDGMFDLNPRVHLDEVMIPLAVHQELDSPRIAVFHITGNIECCRAELFALGLGQAERRCKLHHLLVTALHRTVPVEEVDEVAVVVAKHLYLDMLGVFDVALEEHGGIAERRLRLAPGGHQSFEQLLLVSGNPHPATAAAGRCLDDDRIAVLLGKPECILLFHDRIFGPRNYLHTGGYCRLASGNLVPQRPHHVGIRTDESDPGSLTPFGKIGIFGEKTVAGVNGVHIGLERQGNNLIDAEIGINRRLSLADEVGFVSLVAMQGELVLLRVDGNSADAEFRAGAEYPDCNLAAIGRHDLSESSLLHQIPPDRFLWKIKLQKSA